MKSIPFMLIAFVLIMLVDRSVQVPFETCQTTLNINKTLSPITMNRDSNGCSYIEQFEFLFPDKLVSVSATIQDETFVFNDIPNQNLGLKTQDINRKFTVSRLSYVRVVTPTEHQFTDLVGKLDLTKTMEMQFMFAIDQKLSDVDVGNYSIPQAGVSVIFTSVLPGGSKDYLPDASDYIEQFYPVGSLSPTFQRQYLEVNFKRIFEPLTKYYHQYLGYQGRGILDCTLQTNWYINSQVFLVKQELIDRYRSLFQTSITPDEYGGYPLLPVAQQVLNTLFPIQGASENTTVFRICWNGFEETVMRENYALWLFVFYIFVWWIVCISTENDPPEAYMDELKNNKWTSIPYYSLYKVSNDVFFTKLTRYVHQLMYFSWQTLVISILYAQFYLQAKYGVSDNIVLWYALVSLLISWPVGYASGCLLYNIRQSLKDKYRIQIEWKKIPNKQSRQALDLIKASDDEEDRIYTFYFVFYLFNFLFFMNNFVLSVWQNTYLEAYQQDLWVASLFIIVFLDLFFDIIVAVIPNSYNLTKYRGYYYDFEIGQLYKNLQEM